MNTRSGFLAEGVVNGMEIYRDSLEEYRPDSPRLSCIMFHRILMSNNDEHHVDRRRHEGDGDDLNLSCARGHLSLVALFNLIDGLAWNSICPLVRFVP